MLMDEETAKTKWCPMIRIGAESDKSWACTNREERMGSRPQGEMSRCIASACMAFRWARGSDEVGGYKRVNPEDSRRVGFCGLAGKPEVS